jgi:uncharacterized integral membrane protein
MAKMAPHSKPVEVLYRTGYLIQIFGFIFLFAAYQFVKLNLFFSIIGYVCVNLGIFISALLIQVYMRQIKQIIFAGLFVGILLQIIGLFSGIQVLVPLGLGFTFIAAAGLGGKEAYCFAINEGWLMTLVLSVLAMVLIINSYEALSPLFIKLILAITVIDYLSFTIKKYRKPYLGSCERI